MALKTNKNFLLTFDSDQYSTFFSELLVKGVEFEVLNPKDLGQDWESQAATLPKPEISKARLGEMNLLASLLEQYKPKGLFAGLLDTRYIGSSEEIVSAQGNKNEIMSTARILHKYQQNKLKLEQIKEVEKKANKNSGYLCGYNLGAFVSGFDKYVSRIVENFNENHPNQSIDISAPHITLIQKNGFDVIEYSLEDKEIVSLYMKDEFATVRTLSEFKSWLVEQSKDVVREAGEKGVKVENVSKDIIRSMSSLHAFMEIESTLVDLVSYVFKTDEDGVAFAFISVNNSSYKAFEQMLGDSSVKAQEINWNKEILEWSHKGSLNAFQGIAQSVGTINNKEADPTNVIAIFFSIFFAFCLADAVYGLFLAAFCGYFLFFKELKPGLKNIFRLFAVSGLATVVFGVLTNSYLGDLSSYLGFGGALENVQLINVLDVDANVPVNTFLREVNGPSPIVVLMGVALVIGIINLFTAYILKIITSVKSQDNQAVLNDVTWLGFVLTTFGLIAGFLVPSIASVTLILFIIGFLALLTFNNGKGVFGKLISGLGSAYGLISLAADILSYTRLVAVGLTGGIIANVINLLAMLVFDSIGIPGLNVLAAVIVLLSGHTFNLVISLFGAYINPLRLHYVEFLPKFYEGRGRQFKSSVKELTYFRTKKPFTN